MKRRKAGHISLHLSSPLFYLFILVLTISHVTVVNSFEELRCGTMDIRNTPKHRLALKDQKGRAMDSYINCTVLEGSFLMSMMLSKGYDSEADFPKYERLREITGSLLIFQVTGLKSLRWVFPNLRVIGGQNLIQHYSLIIYQNNDLEELGLDQLRIIRNGGVRIADNPKMCNARSIDWARIQAGPINDLLVDDAVAIGVGEGKIAPCEPTCTHRNHSDRCHYTHRNNINIPACFGPESCQLYCEFDRIENGNGSIAGPGCADDTFERCHDECVAGCARPNDPSACYACAHISHQGKCIRSCPKNLYSYLDRRCITKKVCENLQPRPSSGKLDFWKAVDGKCDYRCPAGFEEDPDNRSLCRVCVGECHRVCAGNGTIDNLSKAKFIAGCSIIDGYLEVEMRTGMEFVAAEELTKCFEKIQVINGYLLIRHSPAFVNLNMFKSLTNITGHYLYREKYALSVYENPNLQKIFSPAKNLTIGRGYLQFHNNRMLCFRHIEEFMASLNRTKEMEENDQSRTSNGDKAICEESSFDVTVELITHNSFVLKWIPYSTYDIDFRKFLGYEVLYKEVPSINYNMSIDDDRSACSDSWMRHFQEVNNKVSDEGHVLSDVADQPKNRSTSEVAALLKNYVNGSTAGEYEGPFVDVMITAGVKPDTIYAFYVTTSLVRHIGARNAVSKLGFVRTHFGVPDPPQITKIEPQGTDKIMLEWEPPRRPNGQITHYSVNYRPIDLSIEKMAKNACENDKIRDDHVYAQHEYSSSQTTPAYGSSLMSSTSAPDTCAAKNCCPCQTDVKSKFNEQVENSVEFENSVQNVMFVQSAERARRSNRMKRAISSTVDDKNTVDERKQRVDSYNEKIEQNEAKVMPTQVNVTGTRIVLEGLKHYTEYFISVVACQNVSVPDHQCSIRKAWRYQRTAKIDDADTVDNSTISVAFIGNSTSNIVVKWKQPEDTNGPVVGYKVRVTNVAKQATPIEQCNSSLEIPHPEKEGMKFVGLADGEYRIEVRTISELGVSDAAVREELVVIHTPGFWTGKRIIIFLIFLIFFVGIAGVLGYYFVKKYYGKKVKEYATQLISANPEYLSQNDVYKADHWELARDKLDIREEIGRGTFGKVFKGKGLNVTSVCGEVFGECAIKTVAENACSAERLHFLLEASIMKQFNANYIVKLYGVVSDGQPVLVVMEMMERGNLRDYLRSRRPGDEANVDNLPVPTEDQYYEWAAQIADGMAYLESIRFCHRDLAARNCMVHKDLTVKIGDFGMARDLYYHEYYKPTGKRLMPVRWMAPESLKDGKFDTKSDVWSYGIVLYEMITLGQQPYQGLGNHEVLSFIGMARQVMDPPKDCPTFWYQLMLECWKYSPRDRPSFHQIVRHLSDRVSDTFHALSFVENNETDAGDHGASEGLPAYVEEGHGMREGDLQMEGLSKKGNNRGAEEEPRYDEGERLAVQNGIAEDEL